MSDGSKIRRFAHELRKLAALCDLGADFSGGDPIVITLTIEDWKCAMHDHGVLFTYTSCARNGYHDYFVYCGIKFKKPLDKTDSKA